MSSINPECMQTTNTRRSLTFDAPHKSSPHILMPKPSTYTTQATLILPITPSATLRVSLEGLPAMTNSMGLTQQPPATPPSSEGWLSLPGRLFGTTTHRDATPQGGRVLVPSPSSGRVVPPTTSPYSTLMRSPGPHAPPAMTIPVVLRRRNGEEHTHHVHEDTNVLEFKYWCMATCRAPSHRITLRVHETPPTGSGDYSVTSLKRSFARSFSRKTPGTTNKEQLSGVQQIAGWASYLVMPEVLGREFRGVGVLAWLQQHLLLVLQIHTSEAYGNSCVIHADLYSSIPHMTLSCGAHVTIGQLIAAVHTQSGVSVDTLRMVVYEKRPRWWLIDILLRLVVHIALFHLRIAHAWLTLAAVLVRQGCGWSWCKGGRRDVHVAVEGPDRSYTFTMPMTASIHDVTNAVQQHESQWCIQRIT